MSANQTGYVNSIHNIGHFNAPWHGETYMLFRTLQPPQPERFFTLQATHNMEQPMQCGVATAYSLWHIPSMRKLTGKPGTSSLPQPERFFALQATHSLEQPREPRVGLTHSLWNIQFPGLRGPICYPEPYTPHNLKGLLLCDMGSKAPPHILRQGSPWAWHSIQPWKKPPWHGKGCMPCQPMEVFYLIPPSFLLSFYRKRKG